MLRRVSSLGGNNASRPSWICCHITTLRRPALQGAARKIVAQGHRPKGQRLGCRAVPRFWDRAWRTKHRGGFIPRVASTQIAGPDHRGRTAYRLAGSHNRSARLLRQPSSPATPPPAVRQSRRFTVGQHGRFQPQRRRARIAIASRPHAHLPAFSRSESHVQYALNRQGCQAALCRLAAISACAWPPGKDSPQVAVSCAALRPDRLGSSLIWSGSLHRGSAVFARKADKRLPFIRRSTSARPALRDL